MALTFEFTNNPADFAPEIILKASTGTAAERIILYNILNGAYGQPKIALTESVQANGMATAVKLVVEEIKEGEDVDILEELKTIDGFNIEKKQFLQNDNGTIKWQDISDDRIFDETFDETFE